MTKNILCLIGVVLFQTCVFANDLYSHPKFANPDIRSNDNFVFIKAGKFEMGTLTDVKGHDETLHRVIISKDFEMQTTAVTQGQYLLVMGYNPSYFKKNKYCKNDYIQIDGIEICPNNPVESVSWEDAQSFINKLNTKDNQYQYRLPTEAEWEYSANSDYYWYLDEGNVGDYTWYLKNSEFHTHIVGTKPANPFGLYDMLGNVYQWVQDWYGAYLSSPQIDPTGPATGTTRVFRGSSWQSFYSGKLGDVRVANRVKREPSDRMNVLGFRLVRTLK